MSFENFTSFPGGADPAAAGGPGGPAPADATMTGQPDAGFAAPAPGEPSAAPVPQQGADGKTTLWYVWENTLTW